MTLGIAPVDRPRLPFRPYLAISFALHAALGGALYWFGDYQVEQHRQDMQVAAGAQATYRARTARRLEDLQKIKELMAQSAMRAPDTDAAEATPAVPSDPREQLAQARVLSKAIDDISRDIKAEELVLLTGKTKDAARAEIDAGSASTTPILPNAGNTVDEIARLEEHARELLARRADDLQRKQEGVAVTAGNQAGNTRREAMPGLAPAGAGGGQFGHANVGIDAGPGAAQATTGKRNDGADGHGRQPGANDADWANASAQAADNINDFLEQGVDPVRAPRRHRTVGRSIRYGNGRIPDASMAGMTKGEGRILGAGGQYADRIYLNSWYLIGPFPGRRDQGTTETPVYPPEKAVLLDAVYRGKDQRLLRWEYMDNMAYPLIPREPVEDAVYYGYTQVWMDQERDLMVWIGVDDATTVYLNDKRMWQSDDTNKGWFFDSVYRNRQGYDHDFKRTEHKMLVRFKKGRNKIFLKLWNDTNEMFFSMVLTRPG